MNCKQSGCQFQSLWPSLRWSTAKISTTSITRHQNNNNNNDNTKYINIDVVEGTVNLDDVSFSLQEGTEEVSVPQGNWDKKVPLNVGEDGVVFENGRWKTLRTWESPLEMIRESKKARYSVLATSFIVVSLLSYWAFYFHTS